jgi:citrate synthase
MTADEAAQELNVELTTLYSYVSRGLLRSEIADEGRRIRRYPAEDVLRLKRRKLLRSDPSKVMDSVLHWGTPVLNSALTLIDGGSLYYRGKSAVDLADSSTIEEAAALMWTGDPSADLFSDAPFALSPRCRKVREALQPASRLDTIQALLPLLATEDPSAYDLRPAQAPYVGARILRQITAVASEDREPDDLPENRPASIAAMIQRSWTPAWPEAERLFSIAMILCADHELNVTSFTARCVASSAATPYQAVIAGISALQGYKYGGATDRVEALFREIRSPLRARVTVANRLRRGESVSGHGHPLYPDGDPRARLLLDRIGEIMPASPVYALARAIGDAFYEIMGEHPNLDFTLVTLCEALGLPAGSAITLFALGRSIGWIGHAIEEYQADRMIRPRARYTGELPVQ